MAVATKDTGVVVQSWVSPRLAAELKRYAEAERRSVSSTIRLALEDRLRPNPRGPAMSEWQNRLAYRDRDQSRCCRRGGSRRATACSEDRRVADGARLKTMARA